MLTSITDYKEKNIFIGDIKVENKLKSKYNHLKNKKYKEIPITIHESEKPSFAFEEIDSMYKIKIAKYSITNYNEKNKNLKLEYKNKYKEIPIIVHNSEKPSFTFEESNTGIPITLHHKLI